jgi:hypothetical protein
MTMTKEDTIIILQITGGVMGIATDIIMRIPEEECPVSYDEVEEDAKWLLTKYKELQSAENPPEDYLKVITKKADDLVTKYTLFLLVLA